MSMKFYWHIHHDRLLEPATEPIENRIAYIKAHKPPEQVETRLRLLKPVRGKLPAELVKAGEVRAEAWEVYNEAGEAYNNAWEVRVDAGEAYDKAVAAYDKAGEVYNEAWGTYFKAWGAYNKALETYQQIKALHAEECPNCPWDGRTIFP